jgi:GNAT superfamily N-acetyltransferase
MQAEATAPDDDLQSLMQWHVVFKDDDGKDATAAASAPAGGGEGGVRPLSACARSFVRVVSHSGGQQRMAVLGLSNVACVASARGKGYGKAVVEAALARLHDRRLVAKGVTRCLFETAIPVGKRNGRSFAPFFCFLLLPSL